MRRPALILGMDRSGEDNRLVRKHPARQLFIIPDEGFLRLLVGLLRQRLRLHLCEPQAVHQLDGART